jgi:hypothetical protein
MSGDRLRRQFRRPCQQIRNRSVQAPPAADHQHPCRPRPGQPTPAVGRFRRAARSTPRYHAADVVSASLSLDDLVGRQFPQVRAAVRPGPAGMALVVVPGAVVASHVTSMYLSGNPQVRL